MIYANEALHVDINALKTQINKNREKAKPQKNEEETQKNRKNSTAKKCIIK